MVQGECTQKRRASVKQTANEGKALLIATPPKIEILQLNPGARYPLEPYPDQPESLSHL
jgi:hypothetical protein